MLQIANGSGRSVTVALVSQTDGWILQRLRDVLIDNAPEDVLVNPCPFDKIPLDADIVHYLHAWYLVRGTIPRAPGLSVAVARHPCVIVTVHHDYLEVFELTFVKHYVMCSRYWQRLVSRRFPHTTLWTSVIPHGGAEDYDKKCEEEPSCEKNGSCRQRPLVVGTLGRRYRDGRKGERLLIEAAKALPRERFRFTFTGFNWDGVVEELQRLGFAAECRYYPDHGYLEVLGRLDIFLSLGALEGGPVGLVQAMGAGVYCIATETGVAPDLIHDKSVGAILTRRTPGELIETLQLLESNRCYFTPRAQERIQARVSGRTWKAFADTYYSLYRSIL